MKAIRNNVVGPITDIASGHLADASEWRKAGLPEVRLW
jgi:hypothetical protein